MSTDEDSKKTSMKRKRNDDEDTNRSNDNASHRVPVVDFLIIGAQKGGTMAAVKNLNKHPDIFVLSECHFFDLYWDMGLNWYRRNLRSNKKIVGEKTPELIYVDDCAARIKEVCPDSKFILFLRDPIKRFSLTNVLLLLTSSIISRAYSSWNMQKSRGQEELPFDECIERELTTMMGQMRTFGTAEYHYIQRGFYLEQIERFLAVFPNRLPQNIQSKLV